MTFVRPLGFLVLDFEADNFVDSRGVGEIGDRSSAASVHAPLNRSYKIPRRAARSTA